MGSASPLGYPHESRDEICARVRRERASQRRGLFVGRREPRGRPARDDGGGRPRQPRADPEHVHPRRLGARWRSSSARARRRTRPRRRHRRALDLARRRQQPLVLTARRCLGHPLPPPRRAADVGRSDIRRQAARLRLRPPPPARDAPCGAGVLASADQGVAGLLVRSPRAAPHVDDRRRVRSDRRPRPDVMDRLTAARAGRRAGAPHRQGRARLQAAGDGLRRGCGADRRAERDVRRADGGTDARRGGGVEAADRPRAATPRRPPSHRRHAVIGHRARARYAAQRDRDACEDDRDGRGRRDRGPREREDHRVPDGARDEDRPSAPRLRSTPYAEARGGGPRRARRADLAAALRAREEVTRRREGRSRRTGEVEDRRHPDRAGDHEPRHQRDPRDAGRRPTADQGARGRRRSGAGS